MNVGKLWHLVYGATDNMVSMILLLCALTTLDSIFPEVYPIFYPIFFFLGVLYIIRYMGYVMLFCITLIEKISLYIRKRQAAKWNPIARR